MAKIYVKPLTFSISLAILKLLNNEGYVYNLKCCASSSGGTLLADRLHMKHLHLHTVEFHY